MGHVLRQKRDCRIRVKWKRVRRPQKTNTTGESGGGKKTPAFGHGSRKSQRKRANAGGWAKSTRDAHEKKRQEEEEAPIA